MISLALHILAWWFGLSFLAYTACGAAGWMLSRLQERVRKQESQRFAWPHKPIRVLELDASQFRRLP